MGGSSPSSDSSSSDGDIITFGDMDGTEANTDVLMDDEEVPF